ncbi:MAG: SpoIID/LytB domain-containing protein [Acaryochloridaceae cyanobacterium RU_4_10]|nr:SpoIID/LytB domain-containing protein [Acaryochloridaceae cyanobacterium RU_4_10]
MPRPRHFKRSLLWIGFWVLFSSPAAALNIRVGLHQDASSITVGSSTPADLVDGRGVSLGQLPALQGFSASTTQGGVSLGGKRAGQITLKAKDNGFVYVGDHWYRGHVRLLRGYGGLTVINDLNLEDYLASVIGKEMYPTWPMEALKAQAVASRSYALYRKQYPKYKLFDVLSTTSSQVYAGLDAEANSTQEAVKATSRQILTHQGKVIEAVFHSSSGGHTENSEDVWMKPVSYLRGVPDFDQSAPVYQWTLNLTADRLRKRITGIGDIISMSPVKASATGRIQTIKVQGSKGDRLMKGKEIRAALGLKSTLFAAQPQFSPVAATPGTKTKPSGFLINGRGSGHGLGMSQWGAHGLASQGKTYREILAHYFKGITIQPMD